MKRFFRDILGDTHEEQGRRLVRGLAFLLWAFFEGGVWVEGGERAFVASLVASGILILATQIKITGR